MVCLKLSLYEALGVPQDAKDPIKQILIATDAAGEGLNLQAAHLMLDYDRRGTRTPRSLRSSLPLHGSGGRAPTWSNDR